MKQWKKILAVIMTFVFIVALVQVNGVETVEASQKAKALKAYQAFLKENSWQDGECMFSGKYFGIKDLNGDKIPELIINTGENKKKKRAYAIITYHVKEDYADAIFTSWVNDECYYNSAKNCLIDDQMNGNSTSNDYDKIVFRITKRGNYKEIAVASKWDKKVLHSEINGKKVTYKKAKAKVDSYAKNAKLLETPYKITKKNIQKYVK